MSECDNCGEHVVDCECDGSDRERENFALYLRDELTRVQGLIRALSLLVTQGDHKLYKHDPVQDIFIIVDEKLDLIEAGLKGL